jgi:trimeric autotransporter adhesin
MAILLNPACDSCSCEGGEVTYLAGDFASVGGQSRNGLCKLLGDGSVDVNWNANPNDAVFAMVLDSGVLYIGGRFTTVGGTARAGLAAVDATTGLLLSWKASAAAAPRCSG